MEREKRIIVPMSGDEVEAVDTWRFANRMPSRAEAIREILRRFIEASSAHGIYRIDIPVGIKIYPQIVK